MRFLTFSVDPSMLCMYNEEGKVILQESNRQKRGSGMTMPRSDSSSNPVSRIAARTKDRH